MPAACYVPSMSNIQVKNVPEEMHAELRRRADEKGLTIRDYVLRLIEKDQLIPTKRQWLDKVAELEPVDTAETAVEAVHRAREERERELEAREYERGARMTGDPRDRGGH